MAIFVFFRKESVLVEQMKREVVNMDKYYLMMIATWKKKKKMKTNADG